MAIFISLHNDLKTFRNPRTGNTISLLPGKETIVENEDDVLFIRGKQYIVEKDSSNDASSLTSFSLSAQKKSASLAPSKKKEEKKKRNIVHTQDVQYNVKKEDGNVVPEKDAKEEQEQKVEDVVFDEPENDASSNISEEIKKAVEKSRE